MKFSTLSILLVWACLSFSQLHAEVVGRPDSLGRGAYIIKQLVEVPVSPEEAYDLMTGDISGWWDHSFSDKPHKLYIEPKPGGHFMEIFDESGDGVQHATVIYARRGVMLRMDGPLGLSGMAVSNVVTWLYEKSETGCKVSAEIHILGEVTDRFAAIGDKVWHHFLTEQFKPYAEAKNIQKK